MNFIKLGIDSQAQEHGCPVNHAALSDEQLEMHLAQTHCSTVEKR
jgi:hypothetical protein